MDASQPPPTTPSRSLTSTQHRLLYRGSLSLPDSHILLEGLTFTLDLQSQHQKEPGTPAATPLALLESPLPLALESMRGRPSLRFVGLTSVKDVWLDESILVNVYVLPECFLSRQYFESVFCAMHLPSPAHTTERGVRVALGDSFDVLIFGRPSPHTPSPSNSPTHKPLSSDSNLPVDANAKPPTASQQPLMLLAARITPTPPPKPKAFPPRPRAPRPDDPTPRKPPLLLARAATKRTASLEDVVRAAGGGPARKRARIGSSSNLSFGGETNVAELGKMARPGGSAVDDSVFKIPAVPVKGKGKGVVSAMAVEDDVFGVPSALPVTTASKAKGKPKAAPATLTALASMVDVDGGGESELERQNKNTVKKSIVQQLSARGILKENPDFKDTFNNVYRGTCFALRARMKAAPIDNMLVNQLVGIHVGMYVSVDG